MDEIKQYTVICPQKCNGDMCPEIVGSVDSENSLCKYSDVAPIIAERDRMYMAHSDMKVRLSALWGYAEIAKQECDCLRELLKELTALVRGECPQLLNEDSGGDVRLSMEIDAALTEVK